MSLGELPEKERRFEGTGFSTGNPSTIGKPLPSPDRVLGVSRPVVVSTTSRNILPLNMRRAYLFFQNRGTDSIFLSFGDSVAGDAAHSNAIEIAPNAVYEPNTNAQYMLCNDVFALSNTDGQLLVVVEGAFTYGG